MSKVPLGIRNNNPGNIRKSKERWKGLSKEQTDPRFFIFERPEWGIRAMMVILRNYQRKYGLKTVTSIISRWAPPTENDTKAYIKRVAGDLKISPTKEIDLRDNGLLIDLVKSIIRHENSNRMPYNETQLAEAVRMI